MMIYIECLWILLPVEVQYGFPAGGEIGTGTNIHFWPLNAKFYARFDEDITQMEYKKRPDEVSGLILV